MHRTALLLLAFALSTAACSKLLEFDRSRLDVGVGPDGGKVPGDGHANTGADTGTPDGLECDLGSAGPDCEPCYPGFYCAGGDAQAEACPPGQWDHDQSPTTPCVLQRECGAGTFVSGRGSPTINRTCTPCASGRFSAQANAELCMGWTACAPGEYIAQAGTTDRDQVCSLCPDGTRSDLPNSGQCVPFGECAAGTRQQKGECTACDVGEYCPGADAPAEACAEGTWDHDANPASPCIEWSECGTGTHISDDGSATSDRKCEDCATGTFADGANAQTCERWSVCIPGQHVTVAGTRETDRDCEGCRTGSYSTTLNARQCSEVSDCEAGEYVLLGASPLSDRVCAPCQSGTFSSELNARRCRPWKECLPGTYIEIEGSSKTDQRCTRCPSGTYSATPNAGECTPQDECAAGTHQVAPGTRDTPPRCEPCDAGMYCPGSNEDPVACGNGTWDHDQNSASPCSAWSDCPAGYHVSESAPGTALADRECEPCDDDRFSSVPNAEACTRYSDCPAGQHVVERPLDGDRRCTDCAPGSFTDRPNLAESCNECEGDTFADEPGATTCRDRRICGDDQWVEDNGSTSTNRVCTPCPEGQTSTGPNATECVDEGEGENPNTGEERGQGDDSADAPQ